MRIRDVVWILAIPYIGFLCWAGSHHRLEWLPLFASFIGMLLMFLASPRLWATVNDRGGIGTIYFLNVVVAYMSYGVGSTISYAVAVYQYRH